MTEAEMYALALSGSQLPDGTMPEQLPGITSGPAPMPWGLDRSQQSYGPDWMSGLKRLEQAVPGIDPRANITVPDTSRSWGRDANGQFVQLTGPSSAYQLRGRYGATTRQRGLDPNADANMPEAEGYRFRSGYSF